MKTGYSLKERIFAMLLSVVMLLGMVPAAVFAVEPGFATIETLTDGFTVGESGNNAEKMVYTYAGTPTWSPANPSIGRNQDGWWIGLKVLAPADASETAGYNYGSGAFTSFVGRWDSPEGAEQKYMEFWFLIKPEYLRDANLTDGLSTYTRCFDWNGDGVTDQTLIVDIDADNTVLLAEDRATVVYPEAVAEYGILETISKGAEVTGNGDKSIVVNFNSDITVNWDPKNEAVGRYQDGWWVGVKMNAPAAMTKTELEKVSYKSGDVVKSFWALRDSTGDGAGQFITMWIPLNGLLSGGVAPYNYAFDWNDDGLFEQSVTIKVDASKIKLMRDGVQEYPALGVVKSFNGGAITGSATGNTTVTIDKLSVDWVDADSNTGRTKGWWAGIWVEAPVSISNDILKNAVLQLKKPGEDWGAPISFWQSKDSADTDATQLIQLWMPLTPDQAAGTENITRNYRFNWDGLGEGDAAYEQTITFTVVPSEKIVLNKQGQAALTFADAAPADIWVGSGTYPNPATGGSGDGEITYAITEGGEFATIDKKTGDLTFVVGKIGKITVTATKAGDTYYKEQTASYTITTVKKVQEVSFKVSHPADKAYEAGLTFPNPVADSVEGVPTYSIVDGTDVATINTTSGELTILKTGTVTVRVDMSETDLYNPSHKTYTLTIVPGENPIAFDKAPDRMIWTGEKQTLAVKDNLGGAITWAITEGSEYATVDETSGEITLLKAGGTFTVTATAAANDNYNEKTIPTSITVDYASQNWDGFGDKTEDTVTYGDNGNKYQLTVDKGIDTAVTYTVTNGADVISVNETTGEITVHKAGTATVRATKAGNDQYNADADEFTLTVKKAENKFTFDKTELSVTYGIESLENPLKNNLSKGAVSYSNEINHIGATVGADGIVTFGDAENPQGSVWVEATVAEDDCYLGYTAGYKVTMDYLVTDAEPIVTGDKKNDSGWFTGNVKINAPEGYLLSREGQFSSEWTESVDFTTEGENLSDAVSLKNVETGYITAPKYVGGINYDKTGPQDLDISYAEPVLETILKSITYGIYKADKLSVTLSAKDGNSGITKVTYNIGGGDVVTDTYGGSATAACVLEIPAQFRGKITLRVEDEAGNVTELVDGRTLVLDTVNPAIEVGYTFGENGAREEAGVYYTQEAVDVSFAITEANFDLSKNTGMPVIKLDGDVVEVTWDAAGKAACTVSGNGDHVLTVEYTDAAGNKMDSYSKEIRISNVKPVIDLSFVQEGHQTVDGTEYFSEAPTVQLKITAHNFDPTDVVLEMTDKDILGNDLDAMNPASYAMNKDRWTNEGDVWTLKTDGMKFDTQAIYTLSVKYTDLSGNAAEGKSLSFVYDAQMAADEVKVQYAERVQERVFDGLTFGFYQKKAVVNVEVNSLHAAVQDVVLTYTVEDGVSSTNTKTFTTEALAVTQDATNKDTFTLTYEIPAQARGKVTVKATDLAGNTVTVGDANQETLVVDDKVPTRTVTYNPVKIVNEATMMDLSTHIEGNESILYFKDSATVVFEITEANFDLSLKNAADQPVIKVNGTPVTVTWTEVKEDVWQASYTIEEDGDYVVTMDYKDLSTNEMASYTSAPLHVDATAPVINVTYTDDAVVRTVDGVDYYKTEQTAAVTVTEHNFRADDVVVTVTAHDITGAVVAVDDYTAYAKDRKNWTNEGDVWTLNTEGMVFDVDAIYTFDIAYTDLSGNAAADYEADSFLYDSTCEAEDVTITYSKGVAERVIDGLTFGFYQEKVLVTVTVKELTSGIENMVLTYTMEAGASSKNTTTFTTEPITMTQGSEKDTFTATYEIPAQARGKVHVQITDLAGNSCTTDPAKQPTLVVDTIVPTRDVTYTSYKIMDAKTLTKVDTYTEGDDSILYFNSATTVTFRIQEANFDLSLKNAADQPVIKVNGKSVSVTWTEIEEDVWQAQYDLTADGDYVITMDYKDLSTNEMVSYTSAPLHVDTTAPVIDVKYTDDARNKVMDGTVYYKTVQTAAITITEHNFRADEVAVTVTAHDITGAVIAVDDYTAYAKDRKNWTQSGDVWTLNTEGMVFDVNAIYTFDIAYKDICDNEAADYELDSFVYDNVSKVSDVVLTYTTPVPERVIDDLTFGFYQEKVLVTVTAKDITAGVQDVVLTYTVEDGVSGTNTQTFTTEALAVTQDDANKDTFTATYEIPAQARGKVHVLVTDHSGNSCTTDPVKEPVLVVDAIAPTREVRYEPIRIVDKPTMLDVQTYTEGDDSILYFNKPATVTFRIKEANFDLSLKNTKDQPVVKVNGTPVTVTWTEVEEDIWQAQYTIEADGDYVVTMEYKDLSTNEMVAYTSAPVHVDTTAPVIDVTFTDGTPTQTIEGTDFYKNVQTVGVKITEHNFRADDVVLEITAKDITGKDVDISAKKYADYVADRANWTQAGDVWTLNTAGMVFDIEAIYQFTLSYTDLATNEAEAQSASFVYDCTAKVEDIDITYSQSVFSEVLESLTFDYYKDDVTVTVTVHDITAGVENIKLTYTLAENVSEVNTKTFTTEPIAAVQDETNKDVFTVSYVIPAQARGKVHADILDFAGNTSTSDPAAEPTIIVDNISPTAEIRYNAPVQTVNGISYYAGNINATININEANFDSDDVQITVTRNGAANPVAVHWNDINPDLHVGTFTLTQEGDYFVNIQYTDKSGNAMTNYTSNELTLDLTAPTIKASAIKANSANKAEPYSFVIEFADINLDVASMKPVLKAVIQENGAYKITEIDLGTAAAVVAGQTYTYTVADLPLDGLYTLTCEVKDLAANTTDEIQLEDEQLYEQVQFSINRNGSAFGYGDSFTEGLNGQYYVYSVEQDVVLIEVNVDPIENYTVKLNGNDLTEGEDYETEQTSKPGEWSKRTYRIHKDLFEKEGEYNIIVTSTDKADTTAFSDIKNLGMGFVVDQTKPVLTITGLTSGGRYQTDAQLVTLIPTDEGGRLKDLKVTVMNSDGEPLTDEEGNDISVRFEMSGEEMLQFLADNDGKVTFTVPEGLNNQVRIVCTDCAVNAENETNTYDELFNNVTVSQNQLIIFYANKPLFYGTIAGVLAVLALIVILVNRKKKSKA